MVRWPCLSEANLITLEQRNDQRYRAIDLAVLTGNIAVLRKFQWAYQSHQKELPCFDLISLLAKQSMLSDDQIQMLDFLRQHHNTDEDLDAWLTFAIQQKNDEVINRFIPELPREADISHFMTLSQQPGFERTNHLLRQKQLFEQWIESLEIHICERLEAYIERDRAPETLLRLAREDGLVEPYVYKFTTTKKKKLTACQNHLKAFFKLKESRIFLWKLYSQLPTNERHSINFISQHLVFLRKGLVNKAEENQSIAFNDQLLTALLQAEIKYKAVFCVDDDEQVDLKSGTEDFTSESPFSPTKMQANSFVREDRLMFKKDRFIEQFAEQFDKTHRFFLCLSTHEVSRKEDAQDKLAAVAKEAAKILPNFHLSAAAIGLSIPFSIEFPSSVAVAAIIDLYLYARERGQEQEIERVAHFFHGSTLRQRTDRIYALAESIAERFTDQIEVLANVPTGIDQFATLAVVRFFNYLIKSDSHMYASRSGAFMTAALMIANSVINVGPQEEAILKRLDDLGVEALSANQFSFHAKAEETKRLTIDSDGDEPNKQWQAKGIFEHTGIRAKDGRTFAHSRQSPEKYGYVYSGLCGRTAIFGRLAKSWLICS